MQRRGETMIDYIEIKGARENNLKNITIKIPKNKLVVLAGPSGSGKSTLAMDILQRECQRQYMESMNLVTDGMSKPKVDAIIGLSPSISIGQSISNKNPRSTVGTVTEIYTYLRILFAKLGERACPSCGAVIKPSFEWIPGEEADFDIEGECEGEEEESGVAACPKCQTKIPVLTMSHFSFNKPEGFCPTCSGLGYVGKLNLQLILDENLTIEQGAVKGWENILIHHYLTCLQNAGKHYGFVFNISKPVRDYNEIEKDLFYYGAESKAFQKHFPNHKPPKTVTGGKFEGIITSMNRKYKESETSSEASQRVQEYFQKTLCEDCQGERLNKASRSVTVEGLNIVEAAKMPLGRLMEWLLDLSVKYTDSRGIVVRGLTSDLTARLQGLLDIGLSYLSIDRPTITLSGGESQRLKLASLLSSGLTGVIYILDEPTTGLHSKDTDKLIASLKKLRDMGNTILVIEHDTDFMKQADYILNFGPYSGDAGGYMVAAGAPSELIKNAESVTGKYLKKDMRGLKGKGRIVNKEKGIQITDAYEHNLKHVDVNIPLHGIVCLTGSSGSGKSTLIFDVLDRAADQYFNGQPDLRLKCSKVQGLEQLSRVVTMHQSPIGRLSRSNVATYTDLFTPIRSLFGGLVAAKEEKLTAKHFSFNVPGGRCEKCGGMGMLSLEMHFLPDVEVPCPACRGKRFKKKVLKVKYKGYSINDVLNLTVSKALEAFGNQKEIGAKLKMLKEIGLGYLKLGQTTSTLSGGECQRIKLAKELSKKTKGHTLYLLDEPTTGLHPRDIEKLMLLLDQLVNEGNTVIVIEHNLEFISQADWIIDLGPEGGDAGGEIIFEGTPHEIIEHTSSATGKCLKAFIGKG